MRQTDTAAVSISYAKVGFYASAFLIPAIFSAPQLVTGTVVNALLLIASMKLSKRELLPVLILPSLGAVTHGVMFGPQTIFLYYFLPCIWLSNYLYATVFSTHGPFVRILMSSTVKYIVLLSTAQIYFRSGVVPSIFVTSMGLVQFITAVLGGVLAYGCMRYLLRYERSKHSH